MRRILWTVGLALLGFWGGWYAQGYPLNFVMLAVFTIWAGCIGFGFGSIFSEHRSRRRIIYWAATFALIVPPPALVIPLPSIALRLSIGVSLGVLLGTLLGTLQALLTRRKSQTRNPGVAG